MFLCSGRATAAPTVPKIQGRKFLDIRLPLVMS